MLLLRLAVERLLKEHGAAATACAKAARSNVLRTFLVLSPKLALLGRVPTVNVVHVHMAASDWCVYQCRC